MFASGNSNFDNLIGSINSIANVANWQQQLNLLIHHLTPVVKINLIRKLLEHNQIKIANYVAELVIDNGILWGNIKKQIFNQLQSQNDLEHYDKFLSSLWDDHTQDILSVIHQLAANLNTRESASFVRNMQSKLGTDDFLRRRSEKSLSRVERRIETFFSHIDQSHEHVKIDCINHLTRLSVFLLGITDAEAEKLTRLHIERARMHREQDKRTMQQSELLQSALNYKFTSISEQRVAEIFDKDEVSLQIKKLSTLGIRIFDVHDIEARKQVVENYCKQQEEKLLYEKSRFEM